LPQAIKDLNVGIVAMIINLVVLLVVSLLTRGMVANQRIKDTTDVVK
jgi:SSS family solute:Na+ symporter